jgi:anion-transporting  ArsA/GET3 family ATPase
MVADTVAFFAAFEGMEQGFRDRAARVEALLGDPGTAFVVVASPRRDAVTEALYFADRLRESSRQVGALVVNRMFPFFGPVPERLTDWGEPLLAGAPGRADGLGRLVANLADLDRVASREEQHVAVLAERLPGVPVVRVPFLADDVHDIAGLTEVGRWLFEPASQTMPQG